GTGGFVTARCVRVAITTEELESADWSNVRKVMAEREGFEPPIPVKVCPLSRRIVSTAHAPLRAGKYGCQFSVLSCRSILSSSSSPRSKEFLQQFGAAARQHAAANLQLMIQLRLIYHLHHRTDRACLGIFSPVDEALEASMCDRTRTHRTRFNCNKQFAVPQAVVTYGTTCLAQGHDFGVSGGIGLGDVAVPAAPHDTSVANDNCPDRHLARLQGPLRGTKGFLHPEFVGAGGWLFFDH